MANTKSIRDTIPCVAAASLEFVILARESFESTPQFHEDESVIQINAISWCRPIGRP